MAGAITGEDEVETTEGTELVIDVFTTNQHFWHFLQSAGINSMRSGIVNAVNRKVAQMDSSFTDRTDYASQE